MGGSGPSSPRGNGGPLDTARDVSFGLLYAAWALLPALLAASGRDLRDAAGPPSRRLLAGLALVAVAQLVVAVAWVPFGPWTTNNHGIERIATLLNAPWNQGGGLGDLHGEAPVALVRLLDALLPGLVTPSGVGLAALITGTFVLGLLARAVSGREDAAWATAAIAGLHPIALRVAPTASPFPLVVAAGALTLLAWTAWLRSGRRETAALVVASALITLQCRAEAPLLLGLPMAALLLAHGRVLQVARRPTTWVAVAAVVALLVPRVLVLWTHLGGEGVPLYTDASGALTDVDAKAVSRTAVLLLGGVALVTAAVGHRRAVPAARWLAAAGALVVAWAWGAPWAPGFDDGVFPALGDAASRAAVSGVLDPRLSAPVLGAAAVVGVALVGLVRPAMGVLLAAGVLATTLPYAGDFDALASVVRMSAPAVPWAAAGAAGWLVLVLERPSRVVLGACAIVVASLVPRIAFLSHRYPMQRDHEVLLRAASAPPDVVLATLSPEDTPDAPDGPWNRDYRRYGVTALQARGRTVVSAHDLLDRLPDGEVWWVRTASCYRPLLRDPQVDRRAGSWLVGERPMPRRVEDLDRHVDLAAMLPCWDDPAAQTCAHAEADTCTVWRCTERHGPAGRPYEDPVCAAVHDAFELEPLLEARVGAGNLSGQHGVLGNPDGVVGVYRVAGPRR